MKPKFDIFSVPPGFVVITYEPGTCEPSDFKLSEGDAKKWHELGYFGGLIIPKGTEWKSYNDQELAAIGLQRIKT